MVVVAAQLHPYHCALFVAPGENGTSHLPRFGDDRVRDDSVLRCEGLAGFAEDLPVVHGFGISVETHVDVFPFEVVLEF